MVSNRQLETFFEDFRLSVDNYETDNYASSRAQLELFERVLDDLFNNNRESIIGKITGEFILI